MCSLVSCNYAPDDELWPIFSRPNFEAVKAITDPSNAFRTLSAKTCRASLGR